MNEIIFSEVLEKKLDGQNLSQLARELGIPKTLLHEWVQSRRMPSMKNMSHVKVLANYLNLTLEELLFGENNSNEKEVITNVIFEDDGRKYQINISKLK